MTDTSTRTHEEVMGLLDFAWRRVRERMDGLSDEEYFWEPAAGCWSVREGEGGTFVADRAEEAPDPPPLTTIAWRMWHIGSQCLAGYSDRFFDGRDVDAPPSWPGKAATGLAKLDEEWERYRSGAEALGGARLWDPIGPLAGPFADATFLAMLLHVEDEVIHHGAEIALLRDLYLRQRA